MSAAEQLPDDTVIAELWRRGEIAYVLRDYQLEIYAQIRRELWGDGGYTKPSGKFRRWVLECCRRWGKSTVIAVIAIELCLCMPGARVYWAAETIKQVRKILRNVLRPILADCPADMRPEWNSVDGFYRFANGSELHISGCEDEAKADRLRGDGADLFVFDEAGSLDLLEYIYRSIALWMVADRGGRLLMASTPARKPGHPFTTYCELAESGESGFAHRDVYDSHFSQEVIEEIAEECGGFTTTEWQREGLALRVRDETRVIVPEFNPERHVVTPGKVPEYAHCYEGMDPGTRDKFGIVWAYWDFERAKLVVQRSYAESNVSTGPIADTLKTAERDLWQALTFWDGRKFKPNPYLRVSDTDARLIGDLADEHGISVVPTAKDDAEAQLYALRNAFRADKIEIWEDSGPLAAQLKAGAWNDKRTDWDRSEVHGHFDCIAALIYLWRNVVRTLNPYPPQHVGKDPQAHHVSAFAAQKQKTQAAVAIERAFVGGGNKFRPARTAGVRR